MATPTTDTEKPRDLRDSWLVRAAVLVAVLAVAFLYVRGCQAQSRPVTQEEAVEVRFIQQGIPARGYWGVSFVDDGPNGVPLEVEVYLVDAKTGDVRPG